MGLSAYYNIQLLELEYDKPISKKKSLKIIMELRKLNDKTFRAFKPDGSQGEEDENWTDISEDMAEFSKRYPNIRFKIYVELYTTDGSCIYYFVNGKRQICEEIVTYDEYDPSKLKKIE